MYRLYRIRPEAVGDGRFAVGRTERWAIEPLLDCTFASYEQAEACLHEKCRRSVEFVRLTADQPGHGPLADSALDEFCTSDRYLHERKFFIGPPPTERIAVALQDRGVRVEFQEEARSSKPT